MCNNTHGSYNCLCFDGYELSIDGFSCIGEEPLMLSSVMIQYNKNYKVYLYAVSFQDFVIGGTF